MTIHRVLWRQQFADKIESKHEVTTDEVEEVLFSDPHCRRAEWGRVKGEDLYAAYGQTTAGRYVVVFFVGKRRAAALPISAREMTRAERRHYVAHR